MASKITLKNGINTEFSIIHNDGSKAKTIASNDMVQAVDTIADMVALLNCEDGQVVIVREDGRGGTFIWSSTGTANDGTVFTGATGYWTRQYDGAVNVKWFGAVGDGVTDDTSIFAYLESSSFNTIELQDGEYKTTLTNVSKLYVGEGKIKFQYNGLSGTKSNVLESSNIEAIVYPNATETSSFRSLVFIGDSITYGYNVANGSTYVEKIGELLNGNSRFQNTILPSGATSLLRGTFGGTAVTYGTSGAIKNSVIMAVGSTITFDISDIDIFSFWFQRTPTSGTITFSVGGSIDCSGVLQDDTFATLQSYKTKVATTSITFMCTVAPVEITGVYFSNSLFANQLSIMNQSMSGYSTDDFLTTATSIGVQTLNNGSGYPLYVVALGTNDIYNPSKAVSSSQFKINLKAICASLRIYGMPILTVPLRAIEVYYPPVLEPFENYRDVIFEISREFGYKVIDLSEIKFDGVSGYQADGLHPTSIGAEILASFYFNKLNLSDLSVKKQYGLLTPISPYTTFGGTYSSPSYVVTDGGIVTLSGFLATNGATKNSACSILPANITPVCSKLFTVGGLDGSSGAYATVQINTDGGIAIFDWAVSLTHVSLEGISFALHT